MFIITLSILFVLSSVNCGLYPPHHDANIETQKSSVIRKWTPIGARKECVEPGYMCEDCGTSTLCIEQDGTWEKKTTTCKTTETCLEATGKCTSDANPDCDIDNIYNFICRKEGMYPNPMSCKTYHLCINDETTKQIKEKPLTFRCPKNYYYNPKTTLCNRKMGPGNTCPSVSQCENENDKFPVIGNSALYYVCLYDEVLEKLTPQVYTCAINKMYNIYTKKCENIKPDDLLDEGTGRCKVLGKFFDPNCLYYRECSRLGSTPTRVACGAGTHFDYNYKQCVKFTCDNVDKY